MSAESARQALIDAVRLDLFGPTGPADTTWPGGEPKVVTTATTFADWKELRALFVDGDGNEVLHGSPLRRYGIGILFPAGLTAAQEEQLDEAQSDLAHESIQLEADLGTEEIEAPPVEDDTTPGHADVDDASETGASPYRPRSMAVSFVLTAGSQPLQVAVTGGRYQTLQLNVAGVPVTFWRRQPVELTAALTPTTGEKEEHVLTDGVLTLRLGATYRRHGEGSIATVYLLNETPGGADLPAATQASLFQTQLTVTARADDVAPYPRPELDEAEDLSLELLYHRHPVRAVGHGCNASCTTSGEVTTIVGEHFPVEVVRSPVPDAVDEDGKKLIVDMDDLGSWTTGAVDAVDAILHNYSAWILARRADVNHLPAHLRDTASQHLDVCETFHRDAAEGWALAQRDALVEKMLRWTSQAMADQRRAYSASTRQLEIDGKKVTGAEGPSPHDLGNRRSAQWRAFQIAFLLAALPGITNPDDDRRRAVDIIWMPTGGGKTEAYSAVAAFTILWQRHHQVRREARPRGTTVLMRYTLRLLTAQQLQRAASLICALENIRCANADDLGKNRFTIGAWLGSASTPNDYSSARRAIHEWRKSAANRGFLLTRCPWCAAAIGRRTGAGQQEIDGYQLVDIPTSGGKRVMAYCPDPLCVFNDRRQERDGGKALGLPVYEVDEDLYAQPPTFLVGTIDKFAMLAWRTEPAAFFGLSKGQRVGTGPSLLIQDELHLISGPLGSLDALYEPVLEDLCIREGGTAPKIIAATATTRRYAPQTQRLYGRSTTRLIPPPGLEAGDNFFSRTDDRSVGKVFVGICAPGFGKAQEAQVRILAALSHAAGSLDVVGENADPWWTNLCFFSSRRSLGQVQSLCQTHLRGHTWRLHRSTGVDAGPRRATGSRPAQRSMVARVELTAHATSDVSAVMSRLEIPYTEKGCADLCFATSMVEVGVDIDRLGLLTMFGQPKSASQYIQVAGRVGRQDHVAPGVVFVVLSPYNSRDRSHFEQFSSFHRRLYASVEPVSITPFTPAALARGLTGALTAWVRQAFAPATPGEALAHLPEGRDVLAGRADSEGVELANLDREYRELEQELDATDRAKWGVLRPGAPTDGFLRPLDGGNISRTDENGAATWLVPTSMRSVDAEAGARGLAHTMTALQTPDTPIGSELTENPVSDEDEF